MCSLGPQGPYARRESSEASIARSAIEDGAVHPLHREAMEMRSAWCDTNERREVGRVRTWCGQRHGVEPCAPPGKAVDLFNCSRVYGLLHEATSQPGLSHEELERWREYGGGALEPVLASGAVALLDAQWIISHEAGGLRLVLTHRQALPEVRSPKRPSSPSPTPRRGDRRVSRSSRAERI